MKYRTCLCHLLSLYIRRSSRFHFTGNRIMEQGDLNKSEQLKIYLSLWNTAHQNTKKPQFFPAQSGMNELQWCYIAAADPSSNWHVWKKGNLLWSPSLYKTWIKPVMNYDEKRSQKKICIMQSPFCIEQKRKLLLVVHITKLYHSF